MTHDHLSPETIEHLIDGLSPADAPEAWAHLRSCASCHLEVEAGHALVAAMEAMPDFAPRTGFADRVMQEVHVFEPWHVALRDTAARWLPAAPVARAAALAGLVTATGLGAAGMWWLLGRADIALLLAQVGLEELQAQLAAAGSAVASALLGQPGREMLAHGMTGRLGFVMLAFACVAGAALAGLRAVALDPVEDE